MLDPTLVFVKSTGALCQARKQEAGHANRQTSSLFRNPIPAVLTFSDAEHLSAIYGADSLSCRFTIFHGDAFGILHFPFGAALNTIGLHLVHLLFV